MRLLADTICGNKNIIDTSINSQMAVQCEAKIYPMLKSGEKSST
jgi:cytochrome c-type biogenesis protein CcmH/NrfF